MAETVGIKETKELLIGLNELIIVIIKQLKDGWNPATDIKELVEKVMTDIDLQTTLLAAYNNIQAVPAEIVDLKFSEGMELFLLQMRNLPRIIEALKK